MLKKLATVVAAPAPQDYFLRHRTFIPPGKSVALLMIAPQSVDAFEAFTRLHRDAAILFHSGRLNPEDRRGLPPMYELAWNHTTLRGLRVDPAITYLQTRYPAAGGLDVIRRIHERLADEVIGHLELIRFNGRLGFAGLPMVRFSTEARLQAIIRRA